MARARNIKPGFFESEQLGRCDLGARLLFIALWQVADRSGRLEERMMRLRAYAFPYDSISMAEVESWMASLEREQLVKRYSVDGVKYIEIPKFTKHQNPHVNEKESVIPSYSSASTVHAQYFQGIKQQKEPEQHNAFCDSSTKEISLSPESLLLNLDIPHSGASAPAPAARQKPAKREFVPPTLSEVEEYCQQEGLIVNPVAFWHHHDDNGWTRGKNRTPIQKWKSVMRIWEENERRTRDAAIASGKLSTVEPTIRFVPKKRVEEEPDDEVDMMSLFGEAPQ